MFRRLCAYVPMCLCAFSRASVPLRLFSRVLRVFSRSSFVPLRLCASVPSSNSGFSLIEVLVSMTVLIVIIVMVTNMFRNASEAWDMGTQRAEMNTSARAAIEYIARELSCAMAGSMPDAAGSIRTLKEFKLVNVNDVFGNLQVESLNFTALSGDNQALRGIRFRYADHTIEADFVTNNFQPYAVNWPVAWNPNLLITNVWRFAVNVFSNESQMAAGAIGWNYDSSFNSNSLPAAVDISIEMLGAKDMARAQGMGDPTGFVMTNSRVYTTRVCFPNRGSR